MSSSEKDINPRVDYEIGSCPFVPNHPQSRVIGIDYYTLINYKSERLDWNSFTLVAKDLDEVDPKFARWWIANIPDMGAHFFYACDKKEPDSDFALSDTFSGQVQIDAEGDNHLSGNRPYIEGQITMHIRAHDRHLYVEEILEGCDPLYFDAKPFYLDYD